MHDDVILVKVCSNGIVANYHLQRLVWTTDPKLLYSACLYEIESSNSFNFNFLFSIQLC